jgi:hypothetical protein
MYRHGAGIFSAFTEALGERLRVEDDRWHVGGGGHVLQNVLTRRVERLFQVAQVD